MNGIIFQLPRHLLLALYDDLQYLKKSIEENEVFTCIDVERLATVQRAINENGGAFKLRTNIPIT